MAISFAGLQAPVAEPTQAQIKVPDEGNEPAVLALHNISTLIISVSNGNATVRNWRDGARAAQGLRPTRCRDGGDSRAVEGAVQALAQAGASPSRARRHARAGADHLVPDRRPPRRGRARGTRPRSG